MKIKSTLHSILVLGAGLSLALFSGCASTAPTVQSHPDSVVNYTNYKSFMMLRPSGLGTLSNPAVTPALVRQVRQDTEAAFVAKGLVVASDAYADALILVHGGVADKIEVQDWGLTYGPIARSRGLGGRQELSSHKEGSLFIDVFDGKTRELIWRGSLVADVEKTPDLAQVKAAVESIVARYPN